MRHANGGKDQEGEQAEQHERADETELLGQQGEHEVGMGLGQKAGAGLRCVAHALAEESARAHGDHGLQQVIAGTRGIGLGVDEDE